MSFVQQSHFKRSQPLRAANSESVLVPSNDVLRDLACFSWLAGALREVMQERGLSRREVPQYVTKVIFLYEGSYSWASGIPVTFHLRSDDIWSMVLADESQRWISRFVDASVPVLRPRESICPRLRLIFMMIATAHPEKLGSCPVKLG